MFMIELKKEGVDRYRFDLKTHEGHVLLKSVEFPNKKVATNTIKELGGLDNTIERKTNYDGKFLFNLKNHVGELIGHSQLYNSEAGMENAIKNTKKVLGLL